VNQRVGDQKNTAQLCEPQRNKQTNRERERERDGGGDWRPEKVKEIVMGLLLITIYKLF
jgi:hypothetical protein